MILSSRTSSRAGIVLLAVGVGLVGANCVTPPPVIPELGSQSLAVRLFVFGADAEDSYDAFQAVQKNNPGFSVVPQGGDVELLVGLEKDSAQCVEPTALCSYKVTYRAKTPSGEVLGMVEKSIMANSDSCSSLCDQALNKVAVEVVGTVSQLAKGGKADEPPAPGPGPSADPPADPPAPASSAAGPHPGKPPPSATASGAPAVPPPAVAAPGATSLCAVGEGPRLPAKEAERRVAQVDALKRLGIIDQAEFDCLRTAYLSRL